MVLTICVHCSVYLMTINTSVRLQIVCDVLFYNERPGVCSNGFLWVIGVIHPVTVGVENSTAPLTACIWLKIYT